jgi:hypothetical protein
VTHPACALIYRESGLVEKRVMDVNSDRNYTEKVIYTYNYNSRPIQVNVDRYYSSTLLVCS